MAENFIAMTQNSTSYSGANLSIEEIGYHDNNITFKVKGDVSVLTNALDHNEFSLREGDDLASFTGPYKIEASLPDQIKLVENHFFARKNKKSFSNINIRQFRNSDISSGNEKTAYISPLALLFMDKENKNYQKIVLDSTYVYYMHAPKFTMEDTLLIRSALNDVLKNEIFLNNEYEECDHFFDKDFSHPVIFNLGDKKKNNKIEYSGEVDFYLSDRIYNRIDLKTLEQGLLSRGLMMKIFPVKDFLKRESIYKNNPDYRFIKMDHVFINLKSDIGNLLRFFNFHWPEKGVEALASLSTNDKNNTIEKIKSVFIEERLFPVFKVKNAVFFTNDLSFNVSKFINTINFEWFSSKREE
jgi:hypothetical protein